MVKLSDYSYDLPENAIADRPPETRGGSRLLGIGRDGTLQDSMYAQLPDFLRPGDLLIINNTKVLPARLKAVTETGAERELLLLEKHGTDSDQHRMHVMYRRKLREGQLLRIGEAEVSVEKIFGNGTAMISSQHDIWELAERYGAVPLPPYMNREADESDRERYQTVFAKETGSVAAPTASLNMTEATLAAVKAKGVTIAEVTLHVGLGTFMPIRTEDVTEHTMHQEYFEVPATTARLIRETKAAGGRIVAVGTTVTRTLEYAADQIMAGEGEVHGEADIFIYPGYQFKLVDAMLTNFHAPHSTVLMMAAAFVGWDTLKTGYEYALAQGYKFLSYGDSTFLQS